MSVGACDEHDNRRAIAFFPSAGGRSVARAREYRTTDPEDGTMDHESFDSLTRVMGKPGSRRAVLGTLLGTGLAGALARGGVSAQTTCPPPDNGVNRSGCDYTGQDFSSQDIHSSTYRNTVFRDTTMVLTDLHSSSMRGADFENANLCRADLSSSVLREVNFASANLTMADLSSSGGCGSATFTAGTTFCQTKMCNGSIRNDDCGTGAVCCIDADCPAALNCVGNICEPIG
jgi:hypothetical protein